MTTKRWRIVLVDDHPLVREGLKGLISREQDLCVSGEAAGIGEALALVHAEQPDLVIVDLALADGDGLDLIQRLKKHCPTLKMLVVTMRDEYLFAERTINAGALGYVDKQAAPAQLIEAVRRTLKGRFYLSPEMIDRMLSRVGGGQEIGSSAFDRLTNRELEVLGLIGQGRTTTEIAELLHLSIKTIETHRAKIKRKLGLRSAPELVRQAVQWELSQT